MPLRKQACVAGALCCVIFTCVSARVVQLAYLGCYIDQSDRDLNGMNNITSIGDVTLTPGIFSPAYMPKSNVMTRELCGAICSLGGFLYLGLQVDGHCFCGNSYGSFGAASETECDWTCYGNSGQKCGGNWRNSVYALTYPRAQHFTNSPMPNQTVVTPQQTFWNMTVRSEAECLVQCESRRLDCQAVIFSDEQRLCHLLMFVYPPATLTGTVGNYFVRD